MKYYRCVVTGTIFACISGADSNSQLYYIDLIVEDSKIRTYPVQNLIGAVTGQINISTLQGMTTGIVLTRNKINRIVLLENGGPNTLPNNIPSSSSMLTMEYNQDTLLLYSSVIDNSVINTLLKLHICYKLNNF